MRASCVFALLVAFACTAYVSAQNVAPFPIVPENNVQNNVPRARYYLQTSISGFNASNAFGTFGVQFAQVADYLDTSYYACVPIQAGNPASGCQLPGAGTATIYGPAGTAGSPVSASNPLPVFTGTTADVIGARRTDPARPVFPRNNILPADNPTRRPLAQVAAAVLGTNADGTVRRVNPADQNSAIVPPERLRTLTIRDIDRIQVDAAATKQIGLTSFTPRSEFASCTFGQIVWVLGGFDASFYTGLVAIPQAALNDVHISLDSGSSWAQVEDGRESDNTVVTPLHWSVRHGNVAVAYKYETPMLNGAPAYRMPCPSQAYNPDNPNGAPLATEGPNARWGPSQSSLPGCTYRVSGPTGNVWTNLIQVRTDDAGLVNYGAAYTGNANIIGAVPYPSGRAQVIRANTPISVASGVTSGYVALLMTSGSAGIPSSSSPVSDAWLSLDFGTSWTLQCFTAEPINNNGPAGSSRIPASNDNNNLPSEYASNLDFTYTVIQSSTPGAPPVYTGSAGFYPAGVAGCGFQARAFHTMVAVPGVGCNGNGILNGQCSTSPPTVLILGGFNAANVNMNDVYRSTNNGQSWTQVNGCDWQNQAIDPLSGQEIRFSCVLRNGLPQGTQEYYNSQGNRFGPTIWSGRNQFASAVVVVTGPGSSTAPIAQTAGNGFNPFNRVVVVGGFSTDDESDVWASDDVLTANGVQASFDNFQSANCRIGGNGLGCGVPTSSSDIGAGTTFSVYQFNQLARWIRLKERNTAAAQSWTGRRGHGLAFLACLGQLFIIGGDSVVGFEGTQDTTTLASRNDVWYSSNSGITWLQLAANGQAGLFPKRDLFGALTTTTSLIVLGGQVQTVNGPRIANNLPLTAENNAVPFYGDVWASTFAVYSYGPYGPCQCDSTLPDSFGFQARAYACASGSPNVAGCCQGTPIIRTRCSCYTWSNPYFTVDEFTNQPARIQYTADGSAVTQQCRASSTCDVYPAVKFLYGRSDCYDRTGYNRVNYTIVADATNTLPLYTQQLNANNNPFVAIGQSVAGGVINQGNWPVVRDLAPYAGYTYLPRQVGGVNYPLDNPDVNERQFLDARDNPCDGYFSQVREGTNSPLPGTQSIIRSDQSGGQSNAQAIRNQLSNIMFNAVIEQDTQRAQTTQAYNINGNPNLNDLVNYADIVSKDQYYYNNIGLARAYYVAYDQVSGDQNGFRRVYLDSTASSLASGGVSQAANLAFNQYQGFYFFPQRQPQLIFPCNRPLCRSCRYSRASYSGVCPVTCNRGEIPLDTLRCLDQFTTETTTFNAQGNPTSAFSFTQQTLNAPYRALAPVIVNPGFGTTFGGFGDPSAASCCTENFNPNTVDVTTGRSLSPYAQGAINPYRTVGAIGQPSYFVNVPYPALTTACNIVACPTHVLGDPEFLGFQGQKYEIHGIPDQIFNIISSPLVQYNARFVYIGHASKHKCDVTRTHPWTHAGTYLGELGFKTAGGDEIVLQSGSCTKGIRSVTVNGKPLKAGHKVALKHQVKASGVHQSISMTDDFNVVLALAEFDITLTNSDNFFNQEVSMTAYGEELLASHGLLGQTWKNETYKVNGVERVIEGVPTDYLIADEDILGEQFTFNKFNL